MMPFSGAKLLDIFNVFAKHNPHNGGDHRSMSRRDLLDATHSIGFNPTKKELREFCADQTEFNFQQFSDFLDTQHRPVAADLLSAFRLIDENGDGSLSLDELKLALTNFGERMSESEVQELVKLFDTDGDGTVDYNEFCDMLVSFDTGVDESTQEVAFVAADQALVSQLETDKNGNSDPLEHARAQAASAIQDSFSDMTAAHAAEPSNLDQWDADRMHGTFQVGKGNRVTNNVYMLELSQPTSVFLSLRLRRDEHHGAMPLDHRFYVVQMSRDVHDSVPRLICASQLQTEDDSSLRCDLNAGSYIVVPQSSGCTLRERQEQPATRVPISEDPVGGGTAFTQAAVNALGSIFARFDFDATGTIGRNEYNMLLLYTTGELCDDDMWAFITSHFETKNAELTFEGFHELHLMQLEQQLEDGGTDDDYYRKLFLPLGFNHALVADETVSFVLFAFLEKNDVCDGLTVLPVDDALSQKADLLDVLETGRCHTLGTSLTLHVRRDALHATLVVKNGGKHLVETLLDCTKSRNVISNRPSLKVPARIPAGGAVLLCHLLPARATAPWSVECTIAS
eukprot:m.771157 g.771157  ORF g.771157 m.771157 type:complete len:568 (-) comp23244_c0_seq12:846-2549(-)